MGYWLLYVALCAASVAFGVAVSGVQPMETSIPRVEGPTDGMLAFCHGAIVRYGRVPRECQERPVWQRVTPAREMRSE